VTLLFDDGSVAGAPDSGEVAAQIDYASTRLLSEPTARETDDQ
jgi:hypothetical protein